MAILESVRRHLAYAARTMRQTPGFAMAAIVALSLGTGGNAIMFSVIRAVLLTPLEYCDPDRLVRVSVDNLKLRAVDSAFSLDQFEAMRAARSFSGLGAFLNSAEDMTLSGRGAPEAITGARVSANFLEILGVQPVLGRSFRMEEEDRPGGPALAMISTRLWMRRFGGDPHVAGSRATINALPYTIVGVLPAGFEFPIAGVDVWVTRPSEWSWLPARYWRSVTLLIGFARLGPGVTIEQAQAELNVLRDHYSAAHPALLLTGATMRVAGLHDQMTANVRSMLWMLFGAVACVLLIACANVAGLLLARAASRSREFAVRAAIGAGRRHLITQLLAESLLLSMVGGLLGLLLARWGISAVAATSSYYATRTGPMLPRAAAIHLDGSVLLFTLALSIASGILFGLFPSLRASRPDLAAALRQSGAAAGAVRGHARWILVAGQTALSVVLLIGAALLLESFARLHAIDPGFQVENLLTLKIALPPARYDNDAKRTAFFDHLVPRVEAVPGVRAAAAALSLPTTSWLRTNVEVIGRPADARDQQFAVLQSTTPEYFRALGIPIRRGREFTDRDNQAGAPPVVIVNESLARRLWPQYPAGPSPVGQYLFEGADKAAGKLEVVGIAADVHEAGLSFEAVPEFYVPLVVHPPQMAYLAVRTSADPQSFVNAVRQQVLAVDKDQPISEIRSMTQLFEASVGPRRLALLLLGAFAAIALLLAVVGIYGIMAFSVAQELGIRRALGAQQHDILRLVLRRGLALALAGIATGAAGAFALTRILRSLLFHVTPTDPAAFLSIACLFLLVALAASYLPARRATAIDPMSALRQG